MAPAQLLAALFAMNPEHPHALFPPRLMRRLQGLVQIDASLVARDFGDPAVAGVLAEAEILVTSWGCPGIDASVLEAAPRLRAVLHAAGSVRTLVGEACWERGLQLSSAVQANALPVAEYTLSAILLAARMYSRCASATAPSPPTRPSPTSRGWAISAAGSVSSAPRRRAGSCWSCCARSTWP